MDYREDIFPLNHFVLWAKGWYHKVHNDSKDENIKLYEELKSVLALDGYSTQYMNIYDMREILLIHFKNYNNWRMQEGLNYVSLRQFLNTIQRYKDWGYKENESIIMSVRGYLQGIAFSDIKLNPPKYSRTLYKQYDLIKGCLCGSTKKGCSYKQMNKEVEKYNW